MIYFKIESRGDSPCWLDTLFYYFHHYNTKERIVYNALSLYQTNIMDFFTKNWKGFLLCLAIAVPAKILGSFFPVVGGPVFAILLGMIMTMVISDKTSLQPGITFTAKKILQYAVVLLGFGLNLSALVQTGKQSLPIIILTIITSLIIAYVLCRLLHIPDKISVLIGVGSSICGGSAIAATAPVIEADDEEIAQAISVIFLFNILAALIFPTLGGILGFNPAGDGFGIFAGTAVNDTSSVTAAASAWDSIYGLGSKTLDTAVTVKLTRTLAIIPITLVLGFIRVQKERKNIDSGGCTVQSSGISFTKVFPIFILFFVLASVLTTVLSLPSSVTTPLKDLSKFFIIMAMGAIGLNTNIVKLIKTGGKPIFMGLCCWIGIALVSLFMQQLLGIW